MKRTISNNRYNGDHKYVRYKNEHIFSGYIEVVCVLLRCDISVIIILKIWTDFSLQQFDMVHMQVWFRCISLLNQNIKSHICLHKSCQNVQNQNQITNSKFYNIEFMSARFISNYRYFIYDFKDASRIHLLYNLIYLLILA